MPPPEASIPLVELPGTPGDAGLVHGRLIADQLAPGFLEAFIRPFCALKRVGPDELREQALAWVERLPGRYREEIEALARGARVPLERVARYLYADIARPGAGTGDLNPAAREMPDGPMCSGVAADTADGRAWVARNCDWYPPLLARGAAAVVHRPPGRIPSMALGIYGDIDCDTGVNAERLWLHVHTFWTKDSWAADSVHPSRSVISWLFWCREALETCATIDEVEAFIASTARDRGVVLFALDGKTGERAVFECTRTGHERLGPQAPGVLFATNHCRAKHPGDPERLSRSRAGSTTRRYEALSGRLLGGHGPAHRPEHGPDDLIELLGDPEVEMRPSPTLATIYSAVCDPGSGETWFARGSTDGAPAPSAGVWTRVPWPF